MCRPNFPFIHVLFTSFIVIESGYIKCHCKCTSPIRRVYVFHMMHNTLLRATTEIRIHVKAASSETEASDSSSGNPISVSCITTKTYNVEGAHAAASLWLSTSHHIHYNNCVVLLLLIAKTYRAVLVARVYGLVHAVCQRKFPRKIMHSFCSGD